MATVASEWTSTEPRLLLDGGFTPAQTWAVAGGCWLALSLDANANLATRTRLTAALVEFYHLPLRADDDVWQFPVSLFLTILAQLPEFLAIAQQTVGTPVCVSPALSLWYHASRLAQRIVEHRDVVEFAAPSEFAVDSLTPFCLTLASGGENANGRWSFHAGPYTAAWLPAWTDRRLRSLRMALLAQASDCLHSSWQRDLGWPQQNHAAVLVDAWLNMAVDARVRDALRREKAAEGVGNSPYRVLYRGEADLLTRWQNSLWAASPTEREFAADGWLLNRLLAQVFSGTGWQAQWLSDRSGSAYYHLEFRIQPPPLDQPTSDWQLRPIVAHNDWPVNAPLADWWATDEETWTIGRDTLHAPDLWILPALHAAAAACPAIARGLRQPAPDQFAVPPDEVLDLVLRDVAALQNAGFLVHAPDIDAAAAAQVKIRVRVKRERERGTGKRSAHAAGGWFDADRLVEFDWTVAIDDEEMDKEEFDRLVATRTPLVLLGGSWKLVPMQQVLAQLRDLGLTGKTVGAAQLTRAAVLTADMDDARLPVQVEVEFAQDALSTSQVVRFMRSEGAPPPVDPPSGFHGVLRQYQTAGLAWLLHLRHLGCGACLADDMGLGKTIQVLAYLLHLQESGAVVGPHLLICPTSLLQNWRAEVGRFTPSLRVYVHHGGARNTQLEDGRDPLQVAVGDADVVMTTYAIAVRDSESLRAISWDAVIADEAQNIKNAATKQARAVQGLSARHRVALTGTPVENRLEELWSIFHFLNPGYLGSLTWFRRTFAVAEAGHDGVLQQRQLQRLVRPLLLRRSKSEPAIQSELPEKWEMREYAALSAEQAALYQSVVNRLFGAETGVGQGLSRRGRILAALVRLKQICDHPCLLAGGTGDVARSGKLSLLLGLLDDVVEEGACALVFSQFRDMGELLCDALALRYGWRPQFLHGGLSAAVRGKMVEDFQLARDPAPVLVLSLKAGGVGLNLTRANYVFHYDRWWNPAVEDQATDRVFRIGQTRDVQVYKLVCAGTLEERIDQLITSKRQLSAAVIGDESESWITELGDQELRELFQLADGVMLADDT